jgi:ketosteroid isomerase-like protein
LFDHRYSPTISPSSPRTSKESTVTTDPKIAAIERFFAAYAAGDRVAIGSVLAEEIIWAIPGHHPLSGTKTGIDEVLAFFDQLATAGFQAEPIFVEASEEYVVDIHRGYTTKGVGQVDTTWALVWHFNADAKVDRVVNLSADQHQMDAYVWANFRLKGIPDRLA